MRGRWYPSVPSFAAVVFSLAIASPAAAQNITVSGRVTSSAGQPLAGASVGIPDLGVGAVASEDGRYSFFVDEARVRNRPVRLVARFIGHRPSVVNIANVTQNISRDFGNRALIH